MKFIECNGCVEQNCSDCLIHRACSICIDDITKIEVTNKQTADLDYSTALILR